MAGSKMGSIKRKMGLKGKTKPGAMIARMNEMKMSAMKGKPMVKKSMGKVGKKAVI